ncbi:MAG: 5'(3')-deoxyribonucleotidase, partial [Bacteroidota bacterium]
MKSTNKKPRICLDMDEVIADTYAKFSRLFKERYGRVISRADYQSPRVREIPGTMELREEYFKPGFFRDLPVMPNAVEVVKELQEGYDIWITTAAAEFKHSLADKYDWLGDHFPFIPWQRFVF